MNKHDFWLQRALTGLTLLGVMVLSTCSVNQVGLGAKVDITPPKVQITNPAEDGQYVKGALALKGTVTDDIKLKDVLVTYTKPDGSSANVPATVTGTNWTLSVPSGTTDGIAEGKQTLNVSATDDSGKVSSDTVLVYIDNLTPTVLVTYPLTYGSDSRPQSTATLDIKGEVSDSSPIKSVEVAVIAADGSVIPSRSPANNPNPKVADGTNTWSARFFLKDPSNGLKVDDEDEYFYRVTATDEAGNVNTWYYHNNDIPNLMPDLDPATPQKEIGPLPTVNELASLDHASAGATSSPTGLHFDDLILKRLGGGSAKAPFGNFQYKAVSAPTIRFSNLDQTKAQNENLLSPGGVVTGTISPPLNAGGIETSSLSVKLYQGATIPGTLLATYGKNDSSNLQLTTLGDSVGFTIPLKNGAANLSAGPYSLVITAKTASSSERSDTVAFFIDSGAPTLTVNQPASFSKSLVELKGDAASSLDLDHIEIYETKNGVVMDRLPNITLTGNSATWTTGEVLPQSKKNGVVVKDSAKTLDGTYEYEVRLVTVSGKNVSLYRSFTYDTASPATEVTASPLVGKKTVNGTLDISGVATDLNGLARVRWALHPTSDGEPNWTNDDSTLLTSPPYTASVDSTTLTDETNYTLWFRVTDKAGNAGLASKALLVSQASDKPVITLTNLDASVKGTTMAAAKANLLQNGAKVLANVTDDDSVSVSTLQAKIDSESWTSVTKKGSDGPSTTFEQNLSTLDDGIHTVSFRASDKFGTRTTLPAVSFVLDTASPTLEASAKQKLTDTSASDWYNDTIVLTGKAKDANGLAKTDAVVITKDDKAKTEISVTPNASGVWTTDELTLGKKAFADGSHTWTVTTTDAVGKTTSLPVTFRIDRTPPTLSVSNLSANDLFSSSTVTLLGVASDGGSAIKRIDYRLNDGSWVAATGTTSWTANLSGLTDSLTNKIDFRATDNAGNSVIAPATALGFRVDLAAPTFTETTSGITSGSLVYKSADVTFGGAVSDGNGLASVVVTYSKDGAAVADLLRTNNPANGTWTATLGTALGDGSYELTFKATDKVGKTTTFLRNVVLDTSAPALTVTAPLEAGGELVATESYTLRGQVTDEGGSGVGSLEFSRDNVTWTPISLSGLNWSKTGINFSTQVGTEAPQGARTVYIRAADKSAHSVTKTVTFNYDTEDPTLSESTSGLTSSLVNRKTPVTFGGHASDSNGISRVRVSLNGVDKGDVTDAGAAFSDWTYFLPTTTEGTFAIVFTATDVAGRTSTRTRNVLIDTTAPTTPVFTTTPGAFVTTSLAIAGTIGDGSGSGVQTVSYRLDGAPGDPATANATGTDDWFSTINISALPEGAHTIAVWGADRAGNKSAEQTQNFIIDRNSPVIASGSAVSQGTRTDLVLSGTATDTYLLGTVTAEYTKNGGTAVAATVGGTPASWTLAVPVALGSGTYVYTVTANDSVGRTASLTRTVIIDVSAPTIGIGNMASNGSTIVNGTTYTVTGTASDVGPSGLASVEYSLDSGASWQATTGTGSWIVALSGLADGLDQPFWLRAADIAGNDATELHYAFDVDQAAPTLTETTSTIPSASVVYRNTDVAFGGTASDGNNLASLVVAATKNGTAIAPRLNSTNPANGAWSASLPISLGDGAYELTFTATDKVGKTTSFIRNVVIDTASPTLPVTAPAAGEVVDSTSFVMRGQVTDNGGKGVSNLAYSRDNVSWTTIAPSGLNWSKTVDFSTPVGAETVQGARQVWIRAQDDLNADTVEHISFFYDTDNPVLTEPTSGLTTVLVNRKTAVVFGGAASDTYAVATVKVSVNGAAAVAVTDTDTDNDPTTPFDTWTYTLPAVNGTYALTFTATDAAGRTSTIQRNVLIDKTAPTTPVFTSSAGAYVTNSLPVAGTAGDGSGSGVQTVYYRLDGNTGDPATGTLTGTDDWFSTLNVSGQGEGAHSVAVWSVDRATNVSAEAVQNYTVDRNDPTLASGEPSTQNTKVDVSLTGTASDANGLASVTAVVRKNAGAPSAATVTGTTSWSISVPIASGDGSYAFTVTATDGVGRQTSLTRTVVIDTTAPTVSATNPANNAVVSDASLSVSGSASDALTGVSLVEYRLNGVSWTPLTGTSNWNGTVALGGEGTKTLDFRSTDALGTLSAIDTVTINLDLSPPSLGETGVGTTSPKRSADFSLSGTASDTNGLQTWDHDANSGTAEVPYVEVSTDGGATKTKVTVSGSSWTYNVTVAPDGSTDGDQNFIVYATDRVGKVTTLSRTVTVDATDPVISIDGVIAGLNVSANKVNGGITFRFSANDAGVGLERASNQYRAYYSFVADGASPAADMTTWTPITSNSSVFSFTVDTSSFGTSGTENRDLWVGVRDGVTGGANVPNSAQVKTDLGVDQESNRPILTTDNLDMAAASNSLNGFGQNPTLLLTIEDDDAVDVSKLQYRIDANNDGDFGDVVELGTSSNKWEDESVWNSVEEVPASDRSLAQAKIKLTSFPQGAFRIQIRARDNTDPASWGSVYGNSANFTWNESPIIRFAVDYGPPSIAVTAPSAGTYNADFTLSGTATDALGVIRVEYTLNGGSSYVNVFTDAAGATSAPFSATVDADVLPTGEYILQVEATDFGGTTATQQIPITIDRTGPTVTLLQPGVHETLNGSSVTVRGEASDNRQLGAVFVWHGKVSDSDPAVLPSRTGPGTYNAGSYTSVTGASVWTTTINTTATTVTAADGYRIRVVGVDSIGNVGTPVDYLVKVDQSADRPTIAFSNLVLPGPSRLALGNLSIIGTATDDDSVRADSLQIRIDRNGDHDFNDLPGEAWVAVNQAPSSNALVVSWVHEITDLFSEGLHYVQVRALDTNDVAGDYSTGFGWNESAVVPFFIDNGPPALEVTTPTLGQRFNVNQFNLTGTSQDTNGIDRILIWVDNDEDSIQDAGEVTTIGGWTDLNSNGLRDVGEGALSLDNTLVNINQSITGLTDGTKTVRVSSYDSSNALTVRELTVVIDTTAPGATVSTPSPLSTVNGTIAVIGTATDNYQVSKVYYNLQLKALAAPAFPAAYTELVGQTYAWNTNINTASGSYPDGEYTLRVVVLDAAGNNSSAAPAPVNFTIDQTTDRPIIDVLTVEEAGTAVDNLLPASLAIGGTVQDDDAVDRTKIQVRSRQLPGGTFSAWANVTGQPATNSSLSIWNHTFTGFADGQYEFEVRAADTYDSGFGGNSSATTVPVKFSVDLSLPAGTISAPVQASFHNADVTVNGVSTDASGIKKVSIAFDTGTGYGAESVLYNDTDASNGYVTPYNWSTSYPVSNGDSQVFFRVTITDAFDKVRTLEQYFTVDTLAPTVSFLLPSAGATVNGSVLARGSANDGNQVSSVYFKVNNVAGPGTWATGDPVTNGWTLLAGKYNWEQRFKSTSLTDGAARVYIMAVDAAGNRSDPTSGANQLDFTSNQTANKPVVTITTPNNALLDNSGTITGTITDDDGVNSGTVEINMGSGWVSVTTASASGPTVTFSHTLAGLPERSAAYTVQVRASDTGEDYTGTIDDIPAVASDIASISIKKDDAAPTIGITNLNNGLLTVTTLQGAYLKDRLTLTGTASDGVQVALVEARLPGITGAGQFGDVAVSNTGTNYSTWSWALTGLTLPSATVNLEVRVTDVNGRTTTTAYTLLVDTVAPSVVIDTAANNPDTSTFAYNGSLVFRGAAADLVKVEKVYYKWGTTAASQPGGTFTGWTEAGSTYSWSTAAFDTTALYSDAVDHTYHLTVVSVDSAGNESPVQDLSFVINQASDRPVIVLSQPTAAQVLETNAKTMGTGNDDDGLASVEYRVDLNNNGSFGDANEGYVNVTNPAVVSGKSLNFENSLASLADGSYKLQVRVRDSGYASASAPLKSFHETETSVMDFSIDKSAPTLSLTQITVQHLYDGGTTVVSSNFNGSYVNNDFTLRFSASDSSGIASVGTSLDNVTFTNATFISGSNYDAALPISAFADGTRSVYYRAIDNNGKTTSGLLTLLVDKSIPVVTFQSPSGIFKDDAVSNAPNVNGTAVTVTGSVTDGSTIATLAIVGGVSDNLALTNTGNNTSWSVTFNATTHANATYAVETGTGTNVWRLPIKVTAYDAAGMRVISTGYVDLDPDGDKPIVVISTPTASASVTGIIALNGTVTDDDGTTGTVDIGLDTDNNGTYTDQVFTNVAVTNGAWTQQINTGGTLSGTINFRVTPKDVNGKLGDVQQRTIFVDSSLPSIVGYNGTSELGAPTPATGTKQKGTITVRALFKDDDAIPAGNLQVSLDGGTTYSALSTQPGYSLVQLADAGGKKRYDVSFTVNTATYFTNNSGNGSGSVILQITDNTYKPAVASLSYSIDNRPPEVYFDPDATLTAPQAGVYSFSGSGSTNLNKVIGTAVDGGSVSGVSSVHVYFVKSGQFRDPKSSSGSTAVTNAVIGDALYTQLAFTAGAIDTNNEIVTLDRTATNTAALAGTVNNLLPVRFIGASLPGGLDADTLYYIRDVVGNTFKLYTSPTGGSPVNLTSTGSGLLEYSLYGIPFTTDAYTDATASGHYAIKIDKRTELGSNDSNGNGDSDGFQESLKDKGGYDEWFAYFDTTKLPDGPLDIYQVTTDESGNRVVGKISGQVTNNPPSVSGLTVGGTAVSAPTWKVKKGAGASASFDVVISASDSGSGANIAVTGWKLEVLDRWGNGGNVAGSSDATYSNWFYGGSTGSPDAGAVRGFTVRGSGSSFPVTATVPLFVNGGGLGQESSFANAYWYRMRATTTDTDGNIATQIFYLQVNNNDTTAPVASIADITSASRSVATGYVEEAGFSKNDAAGSTTTLTTLAADKLSLTSAGLVGNGTVAAGWKVRFSTNEWRTVKSFVSGTGTIVWETALTTSPSLGSSMTTFPGQADISGTVTLNGTAWDDSGVTAVELSLDNGVTWSAAGVSLSAGTGDVVSGYSYTWTYVLNTASVDWNGATAGTPIVGLNKPIKVRAKDGQNTGVLDAWGADPTVTVDVVPYISEVKRLTSGLKTNRSKYGRYSVYESESSIQVLGFNLLPSTAGIYATSAATGTPDALTVSGTGSPYTSFSVATGAATRSGWLQVRVTDNNGTTFLDAINNTNDNTQTYNHAYGTDVNDTTNWSDDRYLFLYRTGEYFGTAANPSANPVTPAMSIDPTSSRLYGAWSTYSTSSLYFASANTNASDGTGYTAFRNRAFYGYDTAEYVDINLDASGNKAISFLANQSRSGGTVYTEGSLGIFTSTSPVSGETVWTDATTPTTTTQLAVSQGDMTVAVGGSSWYFRGEALGNDSMLFQFRNTQVAMNGNNVSWAYWDYQANAVKYAYVLNTSTTATSLTPVVNIDGGTGTANGGDVSVTAGTARTTAAGEYLAMTLDEDGYPLVVYFDTTNQTLKMATSNKVNPTAIGDWSRQTVFQANDPNNPAAVGALVTTIGKHIGAAVDNNGYLHLAFWSEDSGYLYYLKSTNNPEAGAAYTFGNAEVVDSTGNAGTWPDVTIDRTTQSPYISFLNVARINTKDGLKIAYYDSTKGGWESAIVAANTVVVEARSNIEYKRGTVGSGPVWRAAMGYSSGSRFEINYLMPEVP